MAAQNVFPKVNGDAFNGSEANMVNAIFVEAGENITAGNVVYVHLTDGKAYVSDLATQNDRRANGIALNTATVGNDVYIQISGIYATSGLTDKEDYYIGNTGAISTTVSPVRVGTALSTTELYVQIKQDDRDTVGTIKAWLKSHAGMPSSMLNAFWKECDGTAISDTESPLNNAGAGQAPNLQDGNRRMLVGHTASDDGTDSSFSGGAGSHSHTLTYDFAAGGVTKTEGLGGGTHDHYRVDVVFIMKIK